MQTSPLPTAAAPTPIHPSALDLSRIAQDLQIRKIQVESVVQLLDEGNTIPFITRYRKERTGGLNEEVLRQIRDRVGRLREMGERKQTILRSIEGQGKLTEELRTAIVAAANSKELEDLYLPFKPKKSTLASKARDRGLEPFALAVWTRDPAVGNLGEMAQSLVNPEKELNTADDVLLGAQHIIAEIMAETAAVRGVVRVVLWDTASVTTAKHERVAEGQGAEYKDYFQFREAARTIPPHRILAINRGEKENNLTVRLEFDPALVQRAASDQLPLADHPHREFLYKVLDDALARLVLPSLEREIRRELTRVAEDHAVMVFARNLRSLLLQPPLRGKRVLAIDPAFRTGCKVACLDEFGNLLADGVIFPHPPQNRRTEAKAKLEELIRQHGSQVIAIGNGTACRETEELVSDVIAELANPTAPPPVPEPTPEPTPALTPAPEAVAPAPEPTAVVAEYAAPGALSVEGLQPAPEATEPPAPVETPPVAEAPPAPPPPPAPREPLPPITDIAYVIVNEAGASHYSTGTVGREEFPDFDATLRGTISIGRRLQDPLAELVKIDPQNIGVGLYQHDVNPRQLKESLEGVIESCVNHVGVDLNTASVPLLRHVAGMNQLVAQNVVTWRKEHGPFRSREQLRQVDGIGETRFMQAAGFLKIAGGDEPLDRTWIHPESYSAARQLLADLGSSSQSLDDPTQTGELREKLTALTPEEVATRLNVGLPTLVDILEALGRPGRDPREDLPPPVFKKGILKLEDLNPGMELKGTVLNVVDFGAFIDIGLKDSGLVHISQMANRYVKSPYEVVAVGDVVAVWVLGVDKDRRRVSLTMIQPGTERRPPERRGGERGERGAPPRDARDGGPPPRGDRAGDRSGPPPRGRRLEPAGSGPPPRQGGPRPGGPPPRRSGPPPRSGGRRPEGEQRSGEGAQPAPVEAQRRPPKRNPPKPKLSQSALAGATPLRTLGELAAFWEAKKKEDTPVAPQEAPAAVVETPPPAEPVTVPPTPEEPTPPPPPAEPSS
jgi:protein Tex